MALRVANLAPACLLLLACSLLPVHGARPASAGHVTRALQEARTQQLLAKYLSNDELEAKMAEIATQCGGMAKVIRWGKSVKGRDLVALEIYGGTTSERLRPAFKYVGNLHGDEPSGRQLLLALADHLCLSHPSVPAIQRLLKTVSMVLIMSANPDGYDAKHRGNSHQVDLNRNYPDPVKNKGHDLRTPLGSEEAETLAMMNFTLSRRFIGSLAIHEGALVANYPFDGYADGSSGITGARNPTSDDATFVHLAKLYASLHTTMAASKEFPSGITNGAQWYPVYGGMQDWNYLAAGCIELTLELNDQKWPDNARLASIWKENANAFVQYPLNLVLGGLRGTVFSVLKDGSKRGLVATIHVKGQGYNVTSAPAGDFYRPLAPGSYSVVATADGHPPWSGEVTVKAGGQGAVLELLLKPIAPADDVVLKDVVVVEYPQEVIEQEQLMRGWHVMVYVLGVPLLGFVAFLLWRRTQGSKTLEPLYSLIGLSGTSRFSSSV